MRRISLSVCGGVLLPVLYYMTTLGVGYVVHLLVGWGRVAWVLEFLLFLPIGWPEMIYNMLFTREMFDSYSLTFMSMLICGNFILYALLTYALLGRFWRQPKISHGRGGTAAG